MILFSKLRHLDGSCTYDFHLGNILYCGIDIASNQGVNCSLEGVVERFVLSHLLFELCDSFLV